jgi:hypothetical protein
MFLFHPIHRIISHLYVGIGYLPFVLPAERVNHPLRLIESWGKNPTKEKRIMGKKYTGTRGFQKEKVDKCQTIVQR